MAPRGSTMIPFIGINTMRYPHREVDDLRFQKQITFDSGRNLQLMCNIFNVANHQNIDGLGTTAYKLSGTTATYQGQGLRNPPSTPTKYPPARTTADSFTPRANSKLPLASTSKAA